MEIQFSMDDMFLSRSVQWRASISICIAQTESAMQTGLCNGLPYGCIILLGSLIGKSVGIFLLTTSIY